MLFGKTVTDRNKILLTPILLLNHRELKQKREAEMTSLFS